MYSRTVCIRCDNVTYRIVYIIIKSHVYTYMYIYIYIYIYILRKYMLSSTNHCVLAFVYYIAHLNKLHLIPSTPLLQRLL